MPDGERYLFRVYYESIKRESKIRGIKKCRCDERLQTKTKEFTRLPYTGLVLELEHLKIETRLIYSARGWMHQMLTYRYSAPFKTMLKTSPLEVHYNESPKPLVGQNKW